MEWTTTKPTKPGWYWWRKHIESNEKVIGVSTLDIWDGKVQRKGGEWAGPIVAPEEEEE